MPKNFIISDDTFAKLKWENIEASVLPRELIRGCILGVEPTTDGTHPVGVILYVEKRNGNVIAVETLWDNDEGEFLISKADIPSF